MTRAAIHKLRTYIPDGLVNRFYHAPKAIGALLFYLFPAKGLTIIGVTGTDGKTTTANLIHHCLNKAGLETAVISTVSAKIGKEEIPTGLHVTTPDPWQLQRLLRIIKNKKIKYVVIEATSHGLVQNRFLGVGFYMGVITNVTHEHLDYHRTYQNYLKAKSLLFRRVKIAILNKDDHSFLPISKAVPTSAVISTYAIAQDADFTPQKFPFKTSLLGEYNQYNCLAAIAALSTLGVSQNLIKEGIQSFNGVSGRMEKIDKGQKFNVFIDFAHTPNALKNVLVSLRLITRGKLIVVFGCAGLRDVQKRPMMGKIAATLADTVILTAEDPRTEDVNQIIAEIAQGCQKHFSYPDRREAISFAIKSAKKNDTVVICGKGHEQSMCFGTKEYPWSDKQVAEVYLKEVVG